ncbi:TPA: hypothetical protein ACHIEZ_000077 [Klebsiella quasipneumoniae]
MTNNQLTDAQISNATLIRLIRWADEHKSHYVAAALRELQERRKADSEPVAVTDDMAYAFHHALTDSMIGADDVEEIKTGLRAVFANLTAPVVSAEYPDRLPCSVLLEPGLRFGKGIKTSTMLAALARRAVHESDMAALSPEERAEFQARIEDFKALIAPPAPTVPDERDWTVDADDHPLLWSFNEGWNACRAAMLHAGNSPAQSDCCPAQNSATPAQDDNSPVVPDGYVMVPVDPNGDMLAAAQDAYGETDGDIASTLRAAMLAAAPQPQNAPQNIPEIIPDCWCLTCRPVVLNDMRFVVCPDCGNKRCPRANDHRNACTGSNEPGQEGSTYPDTPREVK